MPNKIPLLRFHGRSLSARDPPVLDPHHNNNECKFEGQRQPRLLPNTPTNCLNVETHDDDRYFIRNGMRSSCSSLSPSEERIRRNQEQQQQQQQQQQYHHHQQQQQNQVKKADSSPKLGSGRRLPNIFGLRGSTTSQSSRSSPGGIHLSPSTGDNSLLPPPAYNSSGKNTSSKRLDFRQAHQRSMGQIESRAGSGHSTRDKPSAFSSFDASCTPDNVNLTQKQKPRRFDSTASEDSASTEPSDDKSSGHFGSSGSLDYSLKTKAKQQVKKLSADNRPMKQSQRSASSSKSSLTMKGAAGGLPKLPNNKKLPPISSSSQAIILYCMDNVRGDIASRVIGRMAHKRDDFSNFCGNMNSEQWNEFVTSLRNYLLDVVAHIQSAEKIREISMYFGIKQVPRRSCGFKADYFAVMANALTTECVFLDGAAHQPTEAIEAWAELVELMFSNVRDGYYQQIRYLRKNSQCFNAMFSQSSDQSTDGSDMPSTAPSTTGTLVRQYSEMSISPKHSTNASPVQSKFY